MIDANFPIIQYAEKASPRQCGRQHGEQWRIAIQDLIQIRTGLMREKNPQLNPELIAELAAKQWSITQVYDPELTEELIGIAEGASVSHQEIVILNNYTDFRDIQISEQGCSAICVQRNGQRIAGQTWDMHGSAKRFVCCLKIPATQQQPESIVFSVVGCVGMMGFSGDGSMVGVNNLNTSGARPGVLWPVVIRKLIHSPSLQDRREILKHAPFTSRRSFLLAGLEGCEFWEAAPNLAENVSSLETHSEGHLFHTNHCLGAQARQRETKLALTSTTHLRYELIEKKIAGVDDLNSAWELLNNHEGYPRSICSNYQTNAQDPSITCGGAVGDLNSGTVRMWRGDKQYDSNFVEHQFQLSQSRPH
jgi:isopenicillin-N N-acyltransferase like protein